MNSIAAPLNCRSAHRRPTCTCPSAAAGLVDRGLGGEPVRSEQLHRTVVRTEHGDLVLDHLGAVLVDQATEEDGVRTGGLDLLELRL